MKCRHCDSEATEAVRSGLEFHPVCSDCAAWWAPARRYPLAEVAADYAYE